MIPNDLNYDRILNGLRRVVICLRITRAHVDRQTYTHTNIQTYDSRRRRRRRRRRCRQRKQQNDTQIKKWQNRDRSEARRTHSTLF